MMSMERVRTALTGISGVHITPYGADGRVDEQLLRRIVRSIAEAGVHNVVSAGNTGEFFSLTAEEVCRIQAVAFDEIGSRSLKTAGVGRSLTEAKETAKRAVGAGADAVMVHHPMDPFAAPAAQADYFVAVAEAAAVPAIAYLRTDAIPVADVHRIARHPNVAGIKFATPNLVYLGECMRAARDSDVIWVCGLAEGWAPAFYGAGARGFTSGFVNVNPAHSLSIWQALERGDFSAARRLIEPLAPFEKMRTAHNNGANVTVVKDALALAGLQVGPVRLPGLPVLAPRERDELAGILRGLASAAMSAA